jgi:long-chain acyl-CoA synthetase
MEAELMEVVRVLGGEQEGVSYGLRGGVATIGRDPVSDIVVSDPWVSRQHARLWLEAGVLMVEDTGSTAGTLVNGSPIGHATALRPGDRLRVGVTELEVTFGAPSAPVAVTLYEPLPVREPEPLPPLPGADRLAAVEGNLASAVTRAAARAPDGVAYSLEGAELTWAGLEAASARVAGLLAARGIGPGAAVGLMVPNVPHFPVAYYGILRAGAVVVPLNVLLKPREIAYHLGDAGARALFAWHGFAEEASAGAAEAGAELIEVAPGAFDELIASADPVTDVHTRDGGDVAVVLYTSGTTGQAKGAELTHDNLRENARISAESLFRMTADDVLLGALPLFHVFGQTCCMNAAAHVGARLVLLPRFEPMAALAAMDRERVSVFMGVPTMYMALLAAREEAGADTSALRLCVSGGASLPVEVMRAFEEAFACPVLEGYGLSETSPVASFNTLDRPRKPGSIGVPIDGVEMTVVDDADLPLGPGQVGEVVIRGHNVMRGYRGRPEATAEAMRGGWFHTGDLARTDEEGYFFIVDRKKDMVLRGGMNVYPREIEEVLYEHPAVREAAVVAVPHPTLGEEVGAAVVLREGAEASADELREFVRGQVAAFKFPRAVWFLDSLPKGPTGKILKREIARPEAPG